MLANVLESTINETVDMEPYALAIDHGKLSRVALKLTAVNQGNDIQLL